MNVDVDAYSTSTHSASRFRFSLRIIIFVAIDCRLSIDQIVGRQWMGIVTVFGGLSLQVYTKVRNEKKRQSERASERASPAGVIE